MPEARATYQLDRLRGQLKPFKLHWFPTLGSTNTHAAKMRREGRLVAPSVVLTGNQTAGRGRGANVWHSTRGVMTATFVLPAHDSLPPQHVPLVAGLAVRTAVARFGIDQAKIKWPNDLWVGDRKLAGLLCERIGTVDLIGVGLNVSLSASALPKQLRTSTISLADCLDHPPAMTEVVVSVAHELRRLLGDPRTSLAAVLHQIQSVDALVGRRIRVTDAGQALEGTYDGIDSAGRLRLRTRDRLHFLFTGSISLAKGSKE